MKNNVMRIRRTMELIWTELPKHIKDLIVDYYNFRNDVILPVQSEWSYNWRTLSMNAIEVYYLAQLENGNFKGTLQSFIEDYGLQLEVWLIENFSEELKEVDDIVINVCW